MTNKANKGFVFSAYDKFFYFLLMDNRLFLSIYIGILSFKGYFEKYLLVDDIRENGLFIPISI